MSDTEKPFACPSPGCNMSFVNEDHLTVHKKKHDMILNLGSNGKVNVFVADQTPTPTRFIRNCEEVGLFQDLQNVNPFEETFRRAVEAGKGGTLALPENGLSDDTLHTPHIFPHIIDEPSTSNPIVTQNEGSEPPVISITDSSDDETENPKSNECPAHGDKDASSEETEAAGLDTDSRKLDVVETIVVQEADTSVSTTIVNLCENSPQSSSRQLSVNGKHVQLLMKTEDGKLMQLSAIPIPNARINPTTVNIQSNTQTVVIKTEPVSNGTDRQHALKSHNSSKLALAKMKLKQVLTRNGVITENQKEAEQATIAIVNEGNTRNSDVNKKQDILERNRASSMRARAKRKAWIQQLERTVHNVNETNAILQMEVRALRSEVTKLKTLLLAHKNCPVTKAMEEGNGIILGPKVISVNADAIQTVPMSLPTVPISLPSVPIVTTATAAKRTSVISTDVTSLPKKKPMKKPLISTAVKPVILPKSSAMSNISIQQAKVITNLSALKVVDVEHVFSKKENGEQILIAQTQKRQLVENPRQIIRINPNFELENAASKSTGS